VWPEGRLRGRADRVEEDATRKLRVIENKSGALRDRTGALIPEIGVQVGLYALAIDAITGQPVETVLRGDELVEVPWDAKTHESLQALLERTLATLPPDAAVAAESIAVAGPHCRRCRIRPACRTYLRDAPAYWVAQSINGRMPLDVWGAIRSVQKDGDALRVELRDAAGRFVVITGLDLDWGLQDIPAGDPVYFFALETDQQRQHTERVQPSNFRDAPPGGGSNRRRAFGLRVYTP
jgi:hypothetical protein